ncbi:IS110 family transposase [Micromonospora sp. WMMD710]|uniref:IS110 family transposase n=1 Tax=Micromonospora sp. WMMD710 TaxID=3016085 RepID=UPI00241730F6|nr:IS110 family transposase [Micromonospora sp. WMMD710]MDG4759261.1 IS110 family transposase [Micromonospora sp. WMMD710]
MLFVGDDWAEEHHDVELQDEIGRRLAKAKLPEGTAGVLRLHAMIGEHLGGDDDVTQVVMGIETDRGPWVQALIAAGYLVYAINPLQVARYRERRSASGGKSDTADAHTLTDMVRADRHQLRPVAGDSQQSEAVKVVTRAHETVFCAVSGHVGSPVAARRRPVNEAPMEPLYGRGQRRRSQKVPSLAAQR